MEDKIYTLGGQELTEEQKESVRKFEKEQEEKLKEQSAAVVEARKQKKLFTLEQLLNTVIAPEEDRVLVYPDPVDEITEGGLYKPMEVIDKERQSIGTVIAVGPGKKVEEHITQEILIDLLAQSSNWDDEKKQQYKDKVYKIRPVYKPGEKIVYGRLAGTPMQDPATKAELLIMRPMEIFAKLRPE